MKKLFGTLLLLVGMLLVACAIIGWFGLRRGRFLERRIAGLVEGREGSSFSFDGITPTAELALVVHTPFYGHRSLRVTARQVTIRPRWTSLFTSTPIIESFSVDDATVSKDAFSASALQVKGTCPSLKGGLVLEGTLTGQLMAPLLPMTGSPLQANFVVSPTTVSLPVIVISGRAGTARGQARYERSAAGERASFEIDFGREGLEFSHDDGYAVRPRGRFIAHMHVPPGKSALAGTINMPLAGLAAAVDTPKGAFDLAFRSGTVSLADGQLILSRIKLSAARGGFLSLAGRVDGLDGATPHFNVKLQAERVPLLPLIPFTPPSIRPTVASLPPDSFIAATGSVTGSQSSLRGVVRLRPQGIRLSIPVADTTIPVTMKQGGLRVKLFGTERKVTIHAIVDTPVLLEAAGTTVEITGRVEDLTEARKLSLHINSTKVAPKTIVANLPKDLRRRLGILADSLDGTLAKVAISTDGPLSSPSVTGIIDLAGLQARHASLPDRTFRLTSGEVRLAANDSLHWNEVSLQLGSVRLDSRGQLLGLRSPAPRFGPNDLQVYVPLAELPRIVGVHEKVSMTGTAVLAGTLTGVLASVTSTGTLIAHNQLTAAFTGARKPFRLEGANLRSAWQYDSSTGKLELPALGANFMGGSLAAKASIALTARPPEHALKLFIKGMPLDRILTTGAQLPKLMSGMVTWSSQTTVLGTAGVKSLDGSGELTVALMAINGSKLVELAGWDRYFPAKDKHHKSLGRSLLHGLREAFIATTNNKAVRAYGDIRDVLRRQHTFGTTRATVAVEKGVVHIAPITSTGANSTLEGRLTLRLDTMAIDGLFSAALAYENKVLGVRDIAVRGTASEPSFSMTRPVLDTFVWVRMKKNG